MRWILDAIAVLTLAGLVVAVVMHKRTNTEREDQIQRTISGVKRLEMEIKYRAATQGTELNELGWPVTVDPRWFDNEPPRNTMVTPGRAWVEVAGESEALLTHPVIRMTVDDELAGFWYNPFQGIVRARVPVMVSDRDSTTLYNRLNGSSLSSLLEVEKAKEGVPSTGLGRATVRMSSAPAEEGEEQRSPAQSAVETTPR